MIIEKIEICNLASLEGEQEIDFNAEPLKSAGLFAITGHTGAGKSTILDAICLALYNEAPRLGNRETQAKSSATDEPQTSIYHPLNILRRGQREGYAKVTFSLSDGTEYLAIWRASLTKNNTPRAIERELIQLKPKRTTLAQKSKEVQQLILQLVKLDYSQFTRTVILAQNSFTNFLSAKRGDKSQLLEKITGTEIYAAISREIHQQTQQAATQYTGAQQYLNGLSKDTLIEEDLKREQENQNLYQGLQTKYQNELERITKQLEWYEQYLKATKDLEEKKAQLQQARQALSSMFDQQRELHRYDRLQPFAPTFLHIKQAERAVAQFKSIISSKQLQQDHLLSEVETQERRLSESQARLLNAQQILSIKQPDINRGRNIEGQLLTLKENQKTLSQELEHNQNEITQRTDTHLSKESELSECKKDLESSRLALQTMIQHQPMVSKMEMVRARLEKMNELRCEIEAAQLSLLESNRTQAHWKESCHKLEEQERELQSILSNLKAELLLHEQANKGQNSGEIQVRLNRLSSHAMRSGNAILLWNNIDSLYNEISNKTDELRRRHTQHLQQSQQIRQTQIRLEAIEEAYEQINRTYTLSQSQDIKNLRQELKEGSPCPLCGSTHHPYHSDSEQHLDQLLENLTQQHEQARQKLLEIQSQLTELRQQYSDEQGRLEVEEQFLKRIVLEQKQNIEAWKQYQDMDQSFVQCDENVNRHNRRVILQQIHDTSSHERDQAALQLLQFNKHQDEINRINAEILQAQSRSALNHSQKAQAEASYEVEENKIKQLQQKIEKQRHQLTEQISQVDPLITLSNWKESWRNSYEAFDRELAAIKQRWEECSAQVQEKENAQYRLEQELKTIKQSLQDIQEHHQLLQSRADILQQQIRNQEEELRTLFGNSGVDEEASRLQENVASAQNEVEAAQRTYNQTKEQEHTLSGEIKSLQKQSANQEEELQALRTELDINISRFNAGENSTLQYFELEKYFTNPQDWSNLRKRIDELKSQQEAIAFKVDAASLVVLGLDQSAYRPSETDPQDSQSALLSKQEDLEKDIENNQARLHQSQFKIQSHRLSLEQVEAYRPEFERIESDYRHWKQLSDVLGSADGKSFREIAQCYTFEILVDFANHQLSDLTPRYRLRARPSSLQLEVIDRYMLDQVRPVNSLSGGESFIVSLALALGLSSLSSNNLEIQSLFIDEGFGNLDAANLNLVIDALSNLPNTQHRKVGVISHTELIQSRISPKIHLESQSGGRSKIRIED